jgi:hypothetical protein
MKKIKQDIPINVFKIFLQILSGLVILYTLF